MPGAHKTTIDIRFDGLFLLSFDRQKKSFEAKINTAACEHRLKIVLSKFTYGKNGDGLKRHSSKPLIFRHEQIKSLHPILIFIGEGDEPKPKGNSVKINPGFFKILDLESKQFYKRKLDFKRNNYRTAVSLLNGDVDETSGVCGAYRVKEELIDHLKFRSIRLKKWNEFVAREQAKDPESIIALPEFAGDSKATVEIKKNQKLWVLTGKKGKPLFGPLEPLGPGEGYELFIQYLDEREPLSFAECIGFAYHSRALKLRKGESIFCIFKPNIKSEKDSSTMTSTDSGMCMSARIGSESK